MAFWDCECDIACILQWQPRPRMTLQAFHELCVRPNDFYAHIKLMCFSAVFFLIAVSCYVFEARKWPKQYAIPWHRPDGSLHHFTLVESV